MNNAANTKRTNQVNPHSIIHHPFKNDRNRKKKGKEEKKGGGGAWGNTQTQRRNAVPSQNCGIFWVSADCLLLLTCSRVAPPPHHHHPHPHTPACTTPPLPPPPPSNPHGPSTPLRSGQRGQRWLTAKLSCCATSLSLSYFVGWCDLCCCVGRTYITVARLGWLAGWLAGWLDGWMGRQRWMEGTVLVYCCVKVYAVCSYKVLDGWMDDGWVSCKNQDVWNSSVGRASDRKVRRNTDSPVQ